MNKDTLTMLSVGDLIIGKKDPESYFTLAAPTLRSADIVFGQLELFFTKRTINAYYLEIPTEIPAIPGCDPNYMSALPFAGFNILSLAGNHVWDAGVPGIEDTITELHKYNIAFVGAGMNIDEATRPIIINRNGTRIGFLDYNCVGPKLTWATPDKPGCAYINVITHYELDYPSPGTTIPVVYTFAEPKTMGSMVRDIQKLRPLCDVLVVAFHKGIGFTPVQIAWYEQQISYAAIDAGADLIIGQHTHILKGIEQYKGKTIFHNLGNFVSAMPRDSLVPVTWNFQQWMKKMDQVFGGYNKTNSDSSEYPWHPETAMTIIAKCTIDNRKISRVSYLPCFINSRGQPEILRNDERGQQIFDYMEKITREANLNAQYEWNGDEVIIH